ncbi:hypothetical protein NEOLEDRAFT_117153 [Neolentinus lepideus HHB14362 ss-1]|uniref:Rhodanese domain-containing protein n=1 Tax=Neolentinus lepideus HHB14362 ss-1 TaxID=1314782 RepID=A0A165MUH4_9AGAM|nr:hypothetical protein NEOLEDRAFT_117153 [Neolentinus lepideus HHB14362 ss-1]
MSRQSSRLSSLPSSSSSPAASSQDGFARTGGSTMRTLADVRNQVAQSIAMRTLRKAQVVNGTKVAVVFTLSKNDDEQFLRNVASHIKLSFMLRQDYLFAIATTRASAISNNAAAVIICGSVRRMVQQAAMLTSAKFTNRVIEVYNEGTRWIGIVSELGSSLGDDAALWDVLKKSTQTLQDPARPPAGARSAAHMLADARARLERITPPQAYDELSGPATVMPTVLVDIRPDRYRARYGGISGALVVERAELEWAFDPQSDRRLEVASRYDLRVILLDQDGTASSLAAAALQDLGLLHATDVIGGFAAWIECGLPKAVQPSTFTRWEEDDDESM